MAPLTAKDPVGFAYPQQSYSGFMIALLQAPLGTSFTLQETSVAFAQSRRLGAMGLRAGAPLSVVAKTFGGGRIVEVAGARIALDKGIAARVFLA